MILVIMFIIFLLKPLLLLSLQEPFTHSMSPNVLKNLIWMDLRKSQSASRVIHIHIGKYLSGYPILAVISKLCIISECKDRFESESRASGSFITPRMSPLGVGTQRVDDRFKGPTEPGPIAMAQGAKQLG